MVRQTDVENWQLPFERRLLGTADDKFVSKTFWESDPKAFTS